MAKALAGGGCGHCFDFRNGKPLEYGTPGQPYRGKFTSGDEEQGG